MRKWLRDVVFVPVIIAFVFMLYGAWYSGVKLHAPFSWRWITLTLKAQMPLSAVLIVVLLAVIIPRLKVKKTLIPRVDGFWHLRSCYWYKDPYHENVLVPNLEGMFTLRDSYENTSIIRAYFKGGRAVDSLPEPLFLEPNCPEKFTFSIASTPMATPNEPLVVTLILVDYSDREYEMPPVTVRKATDDEVLHILSRQLYG